MSRRKGSLKSKKAKARARARGMQACEHKRRFETEFEACRAKDSLIRSGKALGFVVTYKCPNPKGGAHYHLARADRQTRRSILDRS